MTATNKDPYHHRICGIVRMKV